MESYEAGKHRIARRYRQEHTTAARHKQRLTNIVKNLQSFIDKEWNELDDVMHKDLTHILISLKRYTDL